MALLLILWAIAYDSVKKGVVLWLFLSARLKVTRCGLRQFLSRVTVDSVGAIGC
jgi:hypothetical protein